MRSLSFLAAAMEISIALWLDSSLSHAMALVVEPKNCCSKDTFAQAVATVVALMVQQFDCTQTMATVTIVAPLCLPHCEVYSDTSPSECQPLLH